MQFKPELYDGSDPFYAPCIAWTGRYPRWKAPQKYLKAGYTVKAFKLPAGHKDDEHQAERARLCRDLTIEMVEWFESAGPRIDPNIWDYLIMRYKSDEFSPIQDVKANTKAGYDQQLARLQEVIGKSPVRNMDYERIRKLQIAMKKKGASEYSIHLFFNTLRRVARYGKALGIEPAERVASVLAEIRFPKGPRRSIYATREHILAIVAQSDAAGTSDFSLGIMLQFELTLRAIDVRGQWLPTNDADLATGGIVRAGKRWQDGLTWDMVSGDLTSITKVISKTAKSMPEARTFDLTFLPEIQTRLRLLSTEGRIGPVIRSSRGERLPYTVYGWSQAWARYRKAAGVPEEIWMMDTRAGAVTEAKMMGADPYALRDAAQHSSINTTNRYARGDGSSKVVQLRKGGK